MITEQQKMLVKGTVPILKANGVALTTYFYKRMLGKNPELRHIFNQANQFTGAQATALAMAVLAYAENIDNPSVLEPALHRIGNKHVSLDVRPEQYAIVGKHLIASIQEVLGASATPELVEAWTNAYKNLAQIMSGVEADMYASATLNGGWSGWRPFVLKQKVKESLEITSFYLYPADGGEVPDFRPGQFITVRLFVPELNIFQPRQYSISCAPNGKFYRISVKKEHGTPERPEGYVSNLLHREIQEGAVIEVSSPSGNFVLNAHDTNRVVFISGGVGITPFMSMLDDMIEQKKQHRPVTWIHGCRGYDVHAFRDRVHEIQANFQEMNVHTFYDRLENEVDVEAYEGYVDLCRVENVISAEADYYICGPSIFIKTHVEYLRSKGINSQQIHYEEFGPSVLSI